MNKNLSWRDLCANWREGDGQDAFDAEQTKRGRTESSPHAAKARRRAGQVVRALALILADCGDPLLQQVQVDRAEPQEDGQLLVTCHAPKEFQVAVAERLLAARGHLTQEVARLAPAKHPPRFAFVVEPQEVDHDV